MRVALVTGGSAGIGAATAEALLAAGYRVAATYAGHAEAAQRFTARTGITRDAMLHKMSAEQCARCSTSTWAAASTCAAPSSAACASGASAAS